MLLRAFIAMLKGFVLGWESWADPSPPPDTLWAPFSPAVPLTQTVIL